MKKIKRLQVESDHVYKDWALVGEGGNKREERSLGRGGKGEIQNQG